jgi:hypothetical protein
VKERGIGSNNARALAKEFAVTLEAENIQDGIESGKSIVHCSKPNLLFLANKVG